MGIVRIISQVAAMVDADLYAPRRRIAGKPTGIGNETKPITRRKVKKKIFGSRKLSKKQRGGKVMKQYTTPDQTAKLIELGFEMPKFEIETQLCNIKGQPLRAATIVGDYSIGELIEMLPSTLSPNNDDDCEFHLMLFDDSLYWHVRYIDGDNFCYPSQAIELINALYDMIVLLKEEGVI